MLAKTHLAFGMLIGLVSLQYIRPENKIAFIAVLSLASIFPDIDSPKSTISKRIPFFPRMINLVFGHRGIFHSIFFAFIIPYLIFYLGYPMYSIAFFIGYLSHLLIDSLTEEGINFLNPVTRFRISGFIRTGTSAELVIFLALLAGIGLVLV